MLATFRLWGNAVLGEILGISRSNDSSILSGSSTQRIAIFVLYLVERPGEPNIFLASLMNDLVSLFNLGIQTKRRLDRKYVRSDRRILTTCSLFSIFNLKPYGARSSLDYSFKSLRNLVPFLVSIFSSLNIIFKSHLIQCWQKLQFCELRSL